MRPLTPALLSLVAALATARLAAQADAIPAAPEVSPAPSTPASASANPPSDPAAPSAETTAPRVRAMSPEVAARLAEKLPKFAPPPTPPAEGSPIVQAPPPESRVADKPLNTIIRLAPYEVFEAKPPAFKERHILTPKGRLDLALKRYPGLNFGNFWIFNNNGIALAMLEEDFAIERKNEMMELTSLIADRTDRAKARDEVQQTFMRKSGL